MKVCPGSAMNGENWDINKKTQDFYDPKTCAIRVKKNFEGKLANNLTIWGNCIYHCHYTQNFISCK